ncbi:hypothetical protein [Diplocloster agilis]|uniref:Uncharacterized protein n=1 Tax=Diplocloster agilis TaxID=2850323 RepID=A0A949JZ84_9FIRM|nr:MULTISPECIES: hypothetical protein [Lachnospiraceae]MBU9735910.1 hypothetical protein [Diplocloster agilis]MBU9743263.1 hypothetical protein [Diplocloster agilis]MCU6732822.1 hypothetical protein [Suonthocola fibrivorans]SCI64331.1 Uncharacterised protein [uncultured Clostridium sp.]
MQIHKYGYSGNPEILILHKNTEQDWDCDQNMLQYMLKYHVTIAALDNSGELPLLIRYLKQYDSRPLYALCVFHDEWETLTLLFRHYKLNYEKLIFESSSCEPGTLVQKTLASM